MFEKAGLSGEADIKRLTRRLLEAICITSDLMSTK